VGIGGTVILIAVGAILTFAVNWHMAGANMHVIGVILMMAGILGLLAYITIYSRRLPPPPPPPDGGHRGDGRPEGFVEERRYYS
jgi:hypothetical protein